MKYSRSNFHAHMIKRLVIPALLILFLGSVLQGKAQNEKVIDEIVALVGSHPVYWSDVEAQYAQAHAQGAKVILSLSGARFSRIFCFRNYSFTRLKLIVLL